MHSVPDQRDAAESVEHRSQPLPITCVSTHKHDRGSTSDPDSDSDSNNDYDEGDSSPSPPFSSTFSEWGTESTTTTADEGGRVGSGSGNGGLFNSSPLPPPFASTFSEWGTESTTTDEGAESDPFCFDDETSRAIIQRRTLQRRDVMVPALPLPLPLSLPLPSLPLSPLAVEVEVVEVEENPLRKPVVCVQESSVSSESRTVLVVAKSNSLLKRWAKAVWGAVAKIFGRRGRRKRGEGAAEGKGGKQS